MSVRQSSLDEDSVSGWHKVQGAHAKGIVHSDVDLMHQNTT